MIARWVERLRARRAQRSEPDGAGQHLDQLGAQRAHVERLADRLEHQQTNNHFRLRVEQALRGQL